MRTVLQWTSKHPWSVTIVVLFAIWSVCMFANAAHAQELDPLQAVQAYMTADPINPDRMGLATPYGRFAVTSYCDWLAPGMNVNEYPNDYLPPWIGISSTDDSEPTCVVHEEGRMSNVACFTNDSGFCDSRVEGQS